MDGENQNSSEKFGTQNADAFGAPVQPPTHPANSTVSSDPPADNKIISSANLTPPTPLSAPLPTDPLHPIQTVGTGSGDVVVGEATKNKKPLIIGAAVLGVALVGIIAIIIALSSKVDRAELAQTFSIYSDLAERGPEGYNAAEENAAADASAPTTEFDESVDNPEPIPEDEIAVEIEDADPASRSGYVGVDPESGESLYTDWALFNLEQSSLSNDEKKSYLDELNRKYDDFLKLAKRAKSGLKTELLPRAERYGETLQAYIQFLTFDDFSIRMLETLLKEDSAAAGQYLDSTIMHESTDAMSNSVFQSMAQYLRLELSLLENYSANGCVVDDMVDIDCAANLAESRTEIADLISEQNLSYSTLTQLIPMLQASLYDQTQELSQFLGDATNEK